MVRSHHNACDILDNSLMCSSW